MTQQYYGPPVQQPVQAPQGYATYPPQQQPQVYQQPTPNQGFGQPQVYQQPYGQQVPMQPPVPAGPPLPQGTLDDFYNQRAVGAGKGLSWNQKPDGYRYIGVVTKTPTNADVFVDTQPAQQGGQPKQNRDGSYKYVLQVQLRIAWLDQFQQFTYPDQDARLFLRGGLRDEVTRAMHESGDEGVPKEGALVDVTLTGRKPGNNIATNIFAVVYRPAGTWENDPQYGQFAPALLGGQAAANTAPQQQAPVQYGGAPQQNQAPYQPQPAQAPAQGVQGYGQAAPNPQQYAQPYPQSAPVAGPAPQYGGQAYDPNTQQQSAPAPSYDQQMQAQGGQYLPGGGQPGYAPNTQPVQANAAAGDPNTQQGQMQLPYGGPQGGPAPAGQMPAGGPGPQGPAPQAQPGTTGSALDPARQQLLARITNQQQPQQQQG